MTENSRTFESSAFSGASNKVRRERSVFHTMLETYTSPKDALMVQGAPEPAEEEVPAPTDDRR